MALHRTIFCSLIFQFLCTITAHCTVIRFTVGTPGQADAAQYDISPILSVKPLKDQTKRILTTLPATICFNREQKDNTSCLQSICYSSSTRKPSKFVRHFQAPSSTLGYIRDIAEAEFSHSLMEIPYFTLSSRLGMKPHTAYPGFTKVKITFSGDIMQQFMSLLSEISETNTFIALSVSIFIRNLQTSPSCGYGVFWPQHPE